MPSLRAPTAKLSSRSSKRSKPARIPPPPAPAAPDADAPRPDSHTAPPAAFVRIGRIAGIHGLRGGLRFRPDNPETDSLSYLDSLAIQIGTELRYFRLLDAVPAGRGTVKVHLEGVADPNPAEALKGGTVMVRREDLPPPGTRQFYYFQALGCEVVLTDGRSIGTVAEIFSNGANDVMVVRDGAREILVPVIEDLLRSLDFDARRIVVEPVPGLLDEDGAAAAPEPHAPARRR